MKSEQDQETIALFLVLSAQIESMCAELYHYYSDLFRDNEDVSRLWKKTALEEENHQKQFELAYRLRDECEFELESNLERVQHIHLKFTHLLKYVRQEPPGIIYALEKAIEMEVALSDIHMESAVTSRDTEMHELFQAMRRFDQGHIEELRQMLTVLKLPQAEMVA